MSLNDPISDLLTRIRNAQKAQHRYVDVGFSNMKHDIVRILKEQGLVDNFLVDPEQRRMRIHLKYDQYREPLVQGLKRISKPGLRRYVKSAEIPKVLGGMGVAILSTPIGILDGKTAREKRVGGELLCFIW